MQAFPEIVVGTGALDTQAGAICAIGARAPLEFWQFAVGYCLDAPDWLPAGSMAGNIAGTGQRFTSRP